MLAIQGRSIQYVREAKFRTDATFAADEILGRMWVDRTRLATYATTYTSSTAPTLATLPGGSMTVAVNGPTVTITVSWTPPGAPAAGHYATTATITGN